MKRPNKALIAAFTLLILWGALHLIHNAGDWNARMTVSVDTPEGIKTGSSVWRVHCHWEPSLVPAQSGGYSVVKGEAVTIDLGKRGLLFALLSGADGDIDYSHDLLLKVFPSRASTASGTKVILTPDQYPMFVRFRDLNDPKTVENVYGVEKHLKSQEMKLHKYEASAYIVHADHFREDFGVGAGIREISIEVTNDFPELKLDKALPWLNQIYGYLSGKHADGIELYEWLDTGDFLRRARK